MEAQIRRPLRKKFKVYRNCILYGLYDDEKIILCWWIRFKFLKGPYFVRMLPFFFFLFFFLFYDPCLNVFKEEQNKNKLIGVVYCRLGFLKS